MRENCFLGTTKFVAEIGPGSYVVGEFVDPDNNPYVMVVNKSTKEPAYLSISFKKEGAVKMISPYNPSKTPFVGEQCWLAPGAGILLTVE